MNRNHKNSADEDSLSKKKYVESINESEEKKNNLNSESDFSSEFEFNYKKQIIDSFELKNKGLFKLSLGKKVHSKSNFINDNENAKDNIQNEKYSKNYYSKSKMPQQPVFLAKDKTGFFCDDKDEIITKLKREITLLTNKFEEKLINIKNIQKDNFHLEQMYKNKYYLDIKKEKNRIVEMRSENDELLRKLDCYNKYFQKLKKKIKCLLRNTLTLVEHFGTSENVKFLFKNVKDITLLMQSIKYKKFRKIKNTTKEECGKAKNQNLGNVKNGNTKEKRNPIKILHRIINPCDKNCDIPLKYTPKKKDKIPNLCTNEEIYLPNGSILKYRKRINNQNKETNNLRIPKNNSFGSNKYSLRKIYNTNLENRQIENSVNSKKKRTITNFTVRMKNISAENSDNLLTLLRKTRKIKYLLRNSFNITYNKKKNYQKGNLNDESYNNNNFDPIESGEHVLLSNYRGSIKHNSLYEREHIAL
ncbi:uncharacterized protein PMUG01_07042600 [Plasmodium malariae]|uniref:Uncharacterized protein n=1 Tax=Plasmodium malariae TaxID=5858 RepID=A0A1D3JN01_PLAMA|nr:uncharacterized protein PMUG01_07042600 [Plasmodium malariae]SBT87963.1 hypothetical protein PMUG01_07042600 [Plasmodium malariae]